MTIYLLETAVYSTCYGDLCEKTATENSVHATLEKAKEVGRKIIKDHIEKLFKRSDYSPDMTLEDFLTDKSVDCSFIITEIDPEIADHYVEPDTQAQCIQMPPHHIRWIFDREGNLLERVVDFGFFVFFTMPEDNLPEAGKKFKTGDFVTIKRPYTDPNQIHVVCGCPQKKDENVFWENVYCLMTIESAEFCDRMTHDHVHESEIVKFLGEVPENHPLRLLRKIFTGEIKVSDETMIKLESGEIALNFIPSWRDLPELNP